MASPNGPGISSVASDARSADPMTAVAGTIIGMFQPESISTSLAPTPATSEPDAPLSAAESAAPQHRIPPGLVRLELFLRVMLSMYISLFVCYAPWSRVLWDQNLVIMQFPTVSSFAAHGAVRGIVTGLGLLNLWITFHDALRQRDR